MKQLITKSYRKMVERFGQYQINQIIDFNTYVKQCETWGIKEIENNIIKLFVE